MIIKLKQGVGRLIRKETDKGIVSILDPRLSEQYDAPYRQLVWDALPIKNKSDRLNKTYDRTNVKAYKTYGTDRINAYQIIEQTLNLKDVRIYDYEEPPFHKG